MDSAHARYEWMLLILFAKLVVAAAAPDKSYLGYTGNAAERHSLNFLYGERHALRFVDGRLAVTIKDQTESDAASYSLWSLMFMLAACAYAHAAGEVSPRAMRVLSLVTAWALRLSTYIGSAGALGPRRGSPFRGRCAGK